LDRKRSHTVLHLGPAFLVPTEEQKTCRKNIEGQRALVSCRKETGYTFPIHDLDLQLIDRLLTREIIAADEKLILEGLLGAGHLGPGMFDKILDLGSERYFCAQNLLK